MNKKILQLILIAVLIFVSSGCVTKKKESKLKPEDKQSQGTTQGTKTNGDIGGEVEDSAPEFNFSFNNVSKERSGYNYTINDIRTGQHEGFERVVIELASDETKTEDPGYKVIEAGKTIEVLFYDTRDVDGNYKLTYQGPAAIAARGEVIDLVQLWYLPDDSMIGVKIALSKRAPFRVSELSNPLRLVIDVEK